MPQDEPGWSGSIDCMERPKTHVFRFQHLVPIRWWISPRGCNSSRSKLGHTLIAGAPEPGTRSYQPIANRICYLSKPGEEVKSMATDDDQLRQPEPIDRRRLV